MAEYGKPVFGTVTEKTPIAVTRCGKVSGETWNGVAVFRGIPYGDDTSCRRFLPPEPAKKWDGIRDCTKNGDICFQYGGSISGYVPLFHGGHPEKFRCADEKMSEDCLNLSVLTPGIDGKKRPVLVYFHGGGFANGTGSLVLGADGYVREQDQVLVGVNHRLNAFGYLYLGGFDPAYESGGMSGMLDLVLALRWVRDNIANFGGDPERVTIMGESGGGSKVSHLLAMPCAKGLFRAAVVESGSSPVATLSRERGTQIARRIMEKMGFTDWRQLLSCAAEDILAVLHDPDLADERVAPVADGIHIPYNEEHAFYSPACARDVAVAIGCSEEEMACFTDYATMTQTDESLQSDLLRRPDKPVFGSAEPICTESNVKRVLSELEKMARPTDDAVHKFQKILSLSTMGKGSYLQSLAMSGDPARTKPTFNYVVRYDTPQDGQGGLPFAAHTSDLPLQMRVVLHEEAEWLSKIMSGMMGAFVRTGDPSAEGYDWPAFTPETQLSMVFDDPCGAQKNPLIPLYEAWATR